MSDIRDSGPGMFKKIKTTLLYVIRLMGGS